MSDHSAASRAQQLVGKVRAHEILRRMLRIRLFEERAIDIHSASRIPGPLHTSIGQEAEIVGACMALRDDDYMTGNHRSHGHPIGKGVDLKVLMAELLGKRTGVCRGKGGSMHLAAFFAGSLGESGIVGAGMPVAAGAGLSAKLRGTDQVCLCFFGDGAANCGPFHEALNLAAIWKLPVVYLCENNGYAVTSPQAQTTAIQNIAQRATSYDIPGVIVDGQDVLAVYEAVTTAVAHARAGRGPTLIEAKTYRYQDHAQFGGLKLRAYRADTEVQRWQTRDPIELFRVHLLRTEQLSDAEFEGIKKTVHAEVDVAVSFAEDSPVPEAAELLEDLYL